MTINKEVAAMWVLIILALFGIGAWYYNERYKEEFSANARIVSKDMHSPEMFFEDSKWMWVDGLSNHSYSYLTEHRYWLILRFQDGPLAGETQRMRVPQEVFEYSEPGPVKVHCVKKPLTGTKIQELF